jgi:integrase
MVRGVAALAIGDDLDDQRKNRARVPLNKRALRYLRVLKAAATCEHVIEWAGRPVLSVKKGFKAAATRAGLPGVTPYTLRHTAASWMAEADVPILDIAKMLGHGDTRITERTYAHLRPSHLAKAAGALKW